MASSSQWPDGMDDHEAVLRLQTLTLDACEGRKDLSLDREYKRLRRPMIQRPDLCDAVPKFIRSQQDLRSFWSYIRQISEQWEPRRRHVLAAFQPLFARVEGKTSPPVTSTKWTGRRTTAQQAQIVLSLAPDALLGVEMLLAEQSGALHNGGPIDPEQQEALDSLRELRDALGELIATAENGGPLGLQLTEVRALKNRILKWSVSPHGLNLAQLPLLGASTVLGAGVMYLVNAISPGDGATVGAAVLAGHVGTAAIQRRRSTSRDVP